MPIGTIDCDNTVFIIDSATIAMMVSIIADGQPIKCIFEKKTGIDDDYSFQMMMNFADNCLKYKQKTVYEVPSNYFIIDRSSISKSIKNLFNFKKEIRKSFSEEKGVIYIGPRTSSIINSLTCSKDKIEYLFHGTGDYIQLIENENTEYKGIKSFLKKILFGWMFGLPNATWANPFRVHGYSMLDVGIKDVHWVNFSLFDSELVNNELLSLQQYMGNDNAIFCPLSDFHKESGINGNTKQLDDQNIELLSRCINKDTVVFLKFHPSLYQLTNENVIIDLDDEIKRKLNVRAYDLRSLIPENIGGIFLPIEVLFKYLGFTSIICLETSAVWNMSKELNIRKYLNIRFSPENRKDLFERIVEDMKMKNIFNESFYNYYE